MTRTIRFFSKLDGGIHGHAWLDTAVRLRHVVTTRRALTATDTEYERFLGTLTGQDFQDEVCDRLRSVFRDFQRVPAKPQGDAGLDGLSHGSTCAYCCYGPEQTPAKLKAKGLKDEIVEKFRGDLLKLFELQTSGKKKLTKTNTGALATVLGQGVKLTNVYLVVNWFEDKRIVGSLNSSFRDYAKASACAFVSKGAQMTIWGPKDLVGLSLVDDVTRFRAENRTLLAKVKVAAASTPPPLPSPALADFDAKFDWLVSQDPGKAVNTNRLREHFRKAWGTALLLDQQLSAESVRLHEALEAARAAATTAADLRSLQGLPASALIAATRDDIHKHLLLAFADGGMLSTGIADGEVARLIGECPLEWRKP
ncbi:MAG: hypothetical protein K8M05_20595 [Deltaproteobacteria bacterium]|nr:hypothetical protein [Kofleriaceae bacterium]